MPRQLTNADAVQPEPLVKEVQQSDIWFFTIQEPTGDEIVDNPRIKYICYQHERGHQTEKLHAHFFVQFKSRVRFSTVKKMWPKSAKVQAPVYPEACRKYCMKEDTRVDGPWEHGEWTPPQKQYREGQGTRSDLLEVQEKLKEGASLKRIAEENFGAWCKYERSFKKYKAMQRVFKAKYTEFNVPKQPLTKSLLIIGTPESGKTQYALSHFENPLLVSQIDDLQLLEEGGYDGIVFDDMRFDHWPAEAVIHLLDIECSRSIHNRYVNAFIPAGTKKIFTSNLEDPFTNALFAEDHKAAIKRRFDVYKVINKLFD